MRTFTFNQLPNMEQMNRIFRSTKNFKAIDSYKKEEVIKDRIKKQILFYDKPDEKFIVECDLIGKKTNYRRFVLNGRRKCFLQRDHNEKIINLLKSEDSGEGCDYKFDENQINQYIKEIIENEYGYFNCIVNTDIRSVSEEFGITLDVRFNIYFIVSE